MKDEEEGKMDYGFLKKRQRRNNGYEILLLQDISVETSE